MTDDVKDLDENARELYSIRHRNFERIRDDIGSTVQLAARLDESIIYVTDRLSFQKIINDEFARRLEAHFKMRPGSMDKDHSIGAVLAGETQADIRYRNLLLLIADCGSTFDLRNRICTRADGSMDAKEVDEFRSALDTKNITDELARKLETKMGKPPGWADQLNYHS